MKPATPPGLYPRVPPTFCFFLGTHQPCHVGRTDVPLMLNRNRLSRFRPVRRALGPWFIDCGAYTMLRKHSRYVVTPQEYVDEVRCWSESAGPPAHVSCQDWLCEPDVIQATGLSVGEHQRLTVESYCLLRQNAPDLPWLPVLQGYSHQEYWDCVGLYEEAGVDLRACPLVGLGSVCMRQATDAAAGIIEDLYSYGLSLHAFGYKISGLPKAARFLASSDSNNWSNAARFDPRGPLPGHKHKSCQGCLEYALLWREKVLRYAGQGAGRPAQRGLFSGAGPGRD